MSDKKRRDITLGEMQDECKKRETRCGLNSDNPCPYDKTCDAISPNGFSADGNGRGAVFPCHWNLTDPPRFNEAQMALLRALRGLGFVSIENIGSGAFKTTSEDGKTGLFMKLLGLEENETLDLAELLGKDGDK